jgi:hypothetical protein
MARRHSVPRLQVLLPVQFQRVLPWHNVTEPGDALRPAEEWRLRLVFSGRANFGVGQGIVVALDLPALERQQRHLMAEIFQTLVDFET